MLTGYISCTSWNQGYYDINTGEYVVSAIAVYSDKLPITNAMQILTFSSIVPAKKYVPPVEEGQAGSFEDVELHRSVDVYFFDAEDNCILHISIGSTSGTTVTRDLTNYPNATKCIIQIMGGSGYRYYVNPEDCTTRTDRTECSINMSYTYTDWVMTADGGRARDAADIEIPEYQSPPPLAAWRIEQGYNGGFPFSRLIPHIPRSAGAFQQAQLLSRVRIPKSVKRIGTDAFSGTALTHVKIAADCTYTEGTSFPEGCIVSHYDDDRYAQLYDCDGKAVLDCNAARIYVLKEELSNG